MIEREQVERQRPGRDQPRQDGADKLFFRNDLRFHGRTVGQRFLCLRGWPVEFRIGRHGPATQIRHRLNMRGLGKHIQRGYLH